MYPPTFDHGSAQGADDEEELHLSVILSKCGARPLLTQLSKCGARPLLTHSFIGRGEISRDTESCT